MMFVRVVIIKDMASYLSKGFYRHTIPTFNLINKIPIFSCYYRITILNG